ncbi:glycosyltransferase family 4 protein [Methanotorris formicicus]|uniref:Glycosyl transferase group 1 n=1 Tax=Methanotorris formicicus Mc-S-70 TaxID=647171 RepID=H1KWG9_9EURY|nr:glycosyltransferase family 4 protein [Methanotorris formicicus]EHP89546.1 glycosyl transferase group 1 [Methanotorris formicicus Mc-S-70]
MKILFLLNSDFGTKNTIGARAKPIGDELIKHNNILKIICRGYNKNLKDDYNIVQIFPHSDIVMKILTAIPIYVSKKFPANEVKNDIFEYFTIKKLKKIDLREYSIIHSWEFLPRVYKHIKEKNPNIKIIQDVPMAFPNVLKEIKDYNILFKGEKLEVSKYVKDALKYIDYYIAPSNFVKKSLINEGIDEEKIFIVPFGVDVEKFKPIEKGYSGIFRVAFSGNVNNRKGIPYLIKAWKGLNLKDAELNIYGRVYPEVKKYFKDAEKYNIKVYGFVDNINEELPKNHIYVFPSLLEGSAKSVYEALSCGLPVITTENAGSIVEDGKEGFIIPIQDVESLKEKILFFYNNGEKIEEFGKRARKKAEQYTWENYGKRVFEIYRLVSKNG